MTSINVSDIQVAQTPVQVVRFGPTGRLATPLNEQSRTIKPNHPLISLYQAKSRTGFDPHCRHSLLLSSAETSRNPFFHQACIFVPQHDELYITSNLLQPASSGSLPIVLISRVRLHRRGTTTTGSDGDDGDGDDVVSAEWQKLRPPSPMAMPAGGTAYRAGMVLCSQGSLAAGTGGLYYMPRGKPPEALVRGFYGRDFNSPHDVARAGDGALWFTDPRRGFELDFRGKPVLPCRVYRFHPETEDLRVVADGLGRPTGIAFSRDERTVYITDTGASGGDGVQDQCQSAAIYAYDVVTRSGSPFLSNKRVFAVPISGAPIGVKCDDSGRVYAGCADGVEIWSAGGTLQAVVEIPGGVTNFCFGRQDENSREMFVCAEQRLWRLHFGGGSNSSLPLERTE